MLLDLVIWTLKSLLVIVVILTMVAYTTLLERRLLARFQLRIGPNRVGRFGLLQPLADGLKLLFKEDFAPRGADMIVFWIAPALSMVTALFVYAVIPFGPPVRIFGRQVPLYIADVNVAVLLVLAVSSIGVYGIILGGWSSNNKFSLLGSLRSSAQLISYELALGLAVISVVLTAGTLSLVEIVNAQARMWFVAYQPVAFAIFLVGAVAETNRAPFDLPEAEHELIGGYQTEYGGFKFGMYYLAEYASIITMSALVVTLFLGGWHGPWLPPVLWFLVKVFVFVFLFIWLRATLPRVRYDHLMALGWKILIPAGLLNVLITSVFLVWRG